jgi:hypothetical protein
MEYDATKIYRPGEDVPRHGSKSSRKKTRNTDLPQRGVSVAGTGKIPASGDRSTRKKN